MNLQVFPQRGANSLARYTGRLASVPWGCENVQSNPLSRGGARARCGTGCDDWVRCSR